MASRASDKNRGLEAGQRRSLEFDVDEFASFPGVVGLDQFGHPGPDAQVNHRSTFHHAPGVKHRNAVGGLLDHLHLVRDQDHGQAEFLVDLLERPRDGARGFRVQWRNGFIRQQHLGPVRQRAGKADRLLLPVPLRPMMPYPLPVLKGRSTLLRASTGPAGPLQG